MGAIPLKLEKAMLKKIPARTPADGGFGPADIGGELASIAASAAAGLAGVAGMIPTPWDETEMHFKFNPTELRHNAEARWRPDPGKKEPPGQQYVGPDNSTLTFKVFLDEWDAPPAMGKDVSDMVKTLHKFMMPAKGKKAPNLLAFIWGKFRFEGFLKSANATYTLFRRDGSPARAEIDCTMVQDYDEAKAQNPTSGGPSGRRTRQLVDGDTLQMMAFAEYGDPNLWRAIADANDVDDPFSVAPGRHLLIPSKADARARR
jgi:hypothetical protein